MRIVPLLCAAALLAFGVVRRRRRARWELALGGVVVLALVAYGAGLFDLPNLKKTIADTGQALGPYTYALVGVLAFLETGAFVGLIAPGETAILVGGVIAGQGEIQIGWLIALVWVAAVAGDSVSFWLGRRLGREFLLRHGPKMQITEERLQTVEAFFGRHGGKTILIGRFVGLVRAVAPFVAGASRMRYRRFLPYDVIGAGLWSTTFCVLGFVFWRSFDKVATYAGQGAFALGTVIVVVVGSISAKRWLDDPEHRRQARAWLHEQAQRPLLRPVAFVVRPLVFSVAVPAWQRARRPARFTWRRLTPGDLGLELTTLVGVAAVGAYALVALTVDIHEGAKYPLGDLRVLRWGDDIRTATLDDVATAVTHLGDGVVLYATALLTAAVAIARRRAIEATALGFGLIVTTITVQLLKAAEDRPRPSGAIVETAHASFPSGHAANGAVYVAVAIVLGRAIDSPAARFALLGLGLALATAIGLSRIYLRAHYLSDVAAGWGLAAVVFGLAGIAGLVVAHLRQNSRP
jgi:membrane protein DedA with SNARE-associated domain/membrane-associated phospholipid phosphatase